LGARHGDGIAPPEVMDEPDSLGAWVGRATGRLRWTRWPDDADDVVRLRAGTGLDGDDGASLWAEVEDRGDDGYVWSIHRREMGPRTRPS